MGFGIRGSGFGWFNRAEQLAERLFAFAADEEVDVRTSFVRLGRKTRIVAADDDARRRSERADEPRNLQRGGALKRHHRQADDVRFDIADQTLDGGPYARLHEDEVGDRDAMMGIDVPGE